LTYGIKGQNLRAKILARREQRNRETDHCALCLTPYDAMRPPAEFGCMRRNKSAIFHRDHVAPKSRGGADSPENSRILCWFCNTARMDMSLEFDTAIAAAGQAFWAKAKELMA